MSNDTAGQWRGADCEWFVRSIKEEALAHIVMLGEGVLSYVIYQYLSHYHTEQNDQDLSNQLIATEPDIGGQNGQVKRRDCLGGLLRYYSCDGVRHGGVFSNIFVGMCTT